MPASNFSSSSKSKRAFLLSAIVGFCGAFFPFIRALVSFRLYVHRGWRASRPSARKPSASEAAHYRGNDAILGAARHFQWPQFGGAVGFEDNGGFWPGGTLLMPLIRRSIHGGWSSEWTFVAAATSSAIGLGSLWRFAYLAGEHGGARFVLVYLLCTLLVAAPVLVALVV